MRSPTQPNTSSALDGLARLHAQPGCDGAAAALPPDAPEEPEPSLVPLSLELLDALWPCPVSEPDPVDIVVVPLAVLPPPPAVPVLVDRLLPAVLALPLVLVLLVLLVLPVVLLDDELPPPPQVDPA